MSQNDKDTLARLDRQVAATADVEVVSAHKGFQGAVALGRSRCVAAHEALAEAASAVATDDGENRGAAEAFDARLEDALDELSVLAGGLRNDLLNLRATDRKALGEDEMARRRGLFAETLDDSPSALISLGRQKATTRLRTAVDRTWGQTPRRGVRPPRLIFWTWGQTPMINILLDVGSDPHD